MAKSDYFKQPSVGPNQAHFAHAPSAEINRSTFDRSHAYKTTFDGGRLIPVFLDEVLPGDTFKMNSTMFSRMATPLKPVLDNAHMDVHFFFVPNRLIWDNWTRFMGERKTIDDDITGLTIPTTTMSQASLTTGTLGNYFGLPYRNSGGDLTVSALPFRAYSLIFDEWYRDENLRPGYHIAMGDGPDTIWANANPQRRGKRHDYFTSCLPWPQKGSAVEIPIATNAPVKGIGVGPSGTPAGAVNNAKESDGVTRNYASTYHPWTANQIYVEESTTQAGFPNIYADLSSATAVTINDLRTAFQIQKVLERDARGGTRYIELVLSHFGVRSDDARLQRPEFLGGSHSMINVNPVAATAYVGDTENAVPQGNLAAYATSLNKCKWEKSFTEHGFVIGIVSTRADLTYQQGIERHWKRASRYDYYLPALAHLGEQAVLTGEIFANGTAADDTVFGYQERWAELRYKPSRITGEFASDQEQSLDIWHYSQQFNSAPTLSASFIDDNPPFKRTLAVQNEPEFLLDAWFDLKCTRPMPTYSIPGLIDHF
mgnify:CR=1 FL=1